MKIKIISYNTDHGFDKKKLKELPDEMEIPDEISDEDIEDYILDKTGVPVYEWKKNIKK